MAGLVGQTGVFPGDRRLHELDLLGDNRNGWRYRSRGISSEPFWTAYRKPRPRVQEGRKPYERLLLFKMLVPQHLYNLSDEQTEYQVRDRLSFQRFLGLGTINKLRALYVW